MGSGGLLPFPLLSINHGALRPWVDGALADLEIFFLYPISFDFVDFSCLAFYLKSSEKKTGQNKNISGIVGRYFYIHVRLVKLLEAIR